MPCLFGKREVAQVVAHLVWDQRVAGSNPVFPTLKGAFWAPFFLCDPGAIRTRDRLIRSEMLYPAELRDLLIWSAKVVPIGPLAYF